MQYTTLSVFILAIELLFYQDFKDTFVCNTQLRECVLCENNVVLSGFQRYFCMQYTTEHTRYGVHRRCFIRISKILLYAIHNLTNLAVADALLFYQDFKDTFVCNTQQQLCVGWQVGVVLSGFQRYFCMQYTTSLTNVLLHGWLFYQDFNEQFAAKVVKNHEIYKFTRKYFDTSEKKTTFAAI